MISEFARDGLFTAAWFGLMTVVWLGWAQEDPPKRWRLPLGIGSILGLILAIGFGVLTALNWSAPSALQGRQQWFGILVGAEFAAAGIGCGLLGLRKANRWMAWWVAVIVALHFIPLAFILIDPSIAVFGVIQLVLVIIVGVRLRGSTFPSSRLVGPVMGASLLLYGLASGVVQLVRGMP
jgi:predicted outer membrane lipoprotein